MNRPSESVWRCVLCVLMVTLASTTAGAQEGRLVLDSLGQTISPFKYGGDKGQRAIVIKNSATLTDLEVRCRAMESFDNTADPMATDTEFTSTLQGVDRIISLQNAPLSPFLFCSLLRRSGGWPLNAQDLADTQAAFNNASADIAKLDPQVQALPEKKVLDDKTAESAKARSAQDDQEEKDKKTFATFREPRDGQIAALRTDIQAFQQREVDTAVIEVKRLQELIRTLQQEIDAEHTRLAVLEQPFVDASDKADKEQKAAQQAYNNLKAVQDLADAHNRQNAAKAKLDTNTAKPYLVLATTHLFQGRRDQPVFYRLLNGRGRADDDQARTVSVERMTAFPVVTTDSRLFAVVESYKREEVSYPFTLTFSTSAGTAPDVAPVRPTTALSSQSGKANAMNAAGAYRDFVMSFGEPFAAQTIIKTTISTVTESVTRDERGRTTAAPPATGGNAKQDTTTFEAKVTRVELVKDELYPQVHALYHFNFTSGVAFSPLREPTFIRRKTQLNDTTTTSVDESRYESRTIEGDISVKPMFAITVYLHPIDVVAPLSVWDRFRPSPTFGFSIVNPQENVFVGFSSEPLRSLQILYGVHVGKVSTARVAADSDVDDPTSNTVQASDKKFAAKPLVGISFNIAFITKIFSGH